MIKNQSLVIQAYFTTFCIDNVYFILGDKNTKLIKFDDKDGLTETNMQIEENDYFMHVNSTSIGDSIYLCGFTHMHVVDVKTKEIRMVREKGYYYCD